VEDKENKGTSGISLPKGGGALKGIGETFQPNLFSGTGNFSIPLATSPGRADFGPRLTLQYSTGNGNGPFGLGWQLSIPRITRKTEKGLPKYNHEDVFIMSGAEGLVPILKLENGKWIPETLNDKTNTYRIERYRPRTESLFARIEKWVKINGNNSGEVHWRATTKENITSIYGRTPQARIYDPDQKDHVYEWLLEETFDARGNHILYEYAKDDPNPGLGSFYQYEGNRTYCQLYLRRIYYGNLPHPLEDAQGNEILYENGEKIGHERGGINNGNQVSTINRCYAFEVVFDYGDWDLGKQHPDLKGQQELFGEAVPLREDPFSLFRSGFEIRTLRRCERVLMFHHFKELEGPTPVKSTDFTYENDPHTRLSLLVSATVTGYRKRPDGSYSSTGIPPLTFKYSQFKPHEQHYQSITARDNYLPPHSLKDPETTLVDLLGNGLPGILHTDLKGFDYWQNLGGGSMDMRHPLHTVPAGVTLSQPWVAFGDMAGDGMADLIVQGPTMAGFFEATPQGGWKPFKKFKEYPSFNLNDPNVRLVDLTGDGRSDVLMTRDMHFLWFENNGEEGYKEPKPEMRRHKLEEFPDVYFNDPSGRVRLADMTGDGLNDIVLLHNGRVDYWPNLGYGKFGNRITMTHAPRLEYNFDPNRLFLVDLDGTGCADLVYVDSGAVYFRFNQSGNSWSEEQVIRGTPYVTDLSSVQFADIFGTGTATLVWSYDYNFQPGGNYKALDFCGGVKPYVLTEMSNNMGATTRVQYAPSTRFYLEDQKNGLEWATNLPFPVHVVEKVEVIDHIIKTKLVTTYKYHHGYYDGREREFRGFGRVDQWDTETFDDFTQKGLHEKEKTFTNKDKAFHVPPVETRTWFHTGVYYDEDRPDPQGKPFDHHELMERYRKEFYQGDAEAFATTGIDFLPGDNVNNQTLLRGVQGGGFLEKSPPGNLHEAYRALRGAALRTEVYSRDGSDKAGHPYMVTCNTYTVKELQPQTENVRHAVFLTTPKESLSYHYERNPQDPRISHNITVETDHYGNITKSLSIGYPRRNTSPYQEQNELKVLFNWTDYINEDNRKNYYYVKIPCETRIFEIMDKPGSWDGKRLLKKEDFSAITCDVVNFNTYENRTCEFKKRIVEWTQTYFRKDSDPETIDAPANYTHRLALGEIERLGLPYETYRACFSKGLLDLYQGRIDDTILKNAGYIKATNDYWWIPSGRQGFNSSQFLLPVQSQDPFGNKSTLAYDSYGLLLTSKADALKNRTEAANNYRVLLPYKITDPNGNCSEVKFDRLGLVIGTAVMGKNGEGDSFEGFIVDLDPGDIDSHLENPLVRPHDILQKATTRLVYDLKRFQEKRKPPVVYTLSRETHTSDENGTPSKIQHSFLYSDGFGREIQTKIQAEPGEVKGVHTDPRWVGTGRKIYNNKGKPVKQYEPFFSRTHEYEDEAAVVETGVSPLLFYDPLERVICTIHPNHTYEKVVFDPWTRETWDVNDTVLLKPGEDEHIKAYVGQFLNRSEPHDKTWYDERIADRNNPPNFETANPEERAALQTKEHAATPTVAHLDTLGRVFLTIADNGKDENIAEQKYETRVKLDIEGNDLRIKDPRGIDAFIHNFDLAGRKIKIDSKDAGISLVLPDVTGNPVYSWDANGNMVLTEYDKLRRPIKIKVKKDGITRLVNHTTYGEEPVVPNAKKNNLCGKTYRVLDDAGELINESYDFKGNLEKTQRKLLLDYKLQVDWNRNSEADLELEDYVMENEYDALNRVTRSITPDKSIYLPAYNEANLLENVKIKLKDESGTRDFIKNIEYNAKGQREKIVYGNEVTTEYTYNSKTYRLLNIISKKTDGRTLQDLRYTYDPVGNITQIHDAVFHIVFNRNQQVDPINKYKYDPIYRLIEASGREHEAMTACHYQANSKKHTEFCKIDYNRRHQPVNNCQALHNYTQYYQYDAGGNITQINHRSRSGWTRDQEYFDDSNRIKTSIAGCPGEADFEFPHDDNGNILKMPHLRQMKWNYANRLIEVETNFQTNASYDRAFYNYDAGGQRVRKVIERGNVRKEERIYIGGYEIYRRYNGTSINFKRSTLHVMDDKKRIALIENKIEDANNIDQGPKIRVRYQMDNHLGSSLLEVDENAKEISYEEYYPYGGTAYMAGENKVEVKLKRYRYSGKERDDETGMYYYGARYYAPCLGRWLSCDSRQDLNDINLYSYLLSNPINLFDFNGEKAEEINDLDNNTRTNGIIAIMVGTDDPSGRHSLNTPKNFVKKVDILLNTNNIDRPLYKQGDRILVFVPDGMSNQNIDELLSYGKTYGRFFTVHKLPVEELIPTLRQYSDSYGKIKSLYYFGHGRLGYPLWDYTNRGIKFPSADDFSDLKFSAQAAAYFMTCNSYMYAEDFSEKTKVTTTGTEGTVYYRLNEIVAAKRDKDSSHREYRKFGSSVAWTFTWNNGNFLRSERNINKNTGTPYLRKNPPLRNSWYVEDELF